MCAAAFYNYYKQNQEEGMYLVYVSAAGEPVKMPSEIEGVIAKYSDLFEEPTGVVEREVVHAIEIIPGSSIPRGRIYRMSPDELDELRRQLKELVEKGWIQPSVSPYGSPVLFVPKKKERTLRMCIDYRGLNTITVKNREPLPRIDDLLDRVQGCRYFSKIDLKSGYHQIAIRPEDQHKTAFQTRYGLYEFVVMPFGLCNAPGTFQHAMNRIFHDYLDKFVIVYLDDILIFSKTVEEHVAHLDKVLGLLRQHKFKINGEKCEFGRTRVLYLGHEISAEGLKPNDAKVASIRDWPHPQSVTEMRSFLGMTGYHRTFVKNYSIVAAPLTDLTRLDTPWEWTDKCEAAFRHLKHALTHYEVLKLPDPDKPFIVTTDASQYGIGAMLAQQEGPKLRPIEYMSKKMPSQKLAKSTYEKELYAVYKALTHWRHYLFGRFFILRTDHQTLRWMRTQPVLSDALKRWIEVIEQYDFDPQYLKGEYNKVVDALSRRPDFSGAVITEFDLTDDVTHSLVEAYRQDQFMSEITRKLEAKDKKTSAEFKLVNGLLFLEKAGNKHLCVPNSESLRSLFLGEYHDATGHFGYKKTAANLLQRFWWPTMMKDAQLYMETCQVCQRDKPRTQAPLGLLKPLPIPERPGESLSMDFMDTLVTSKSGMRQIFVIVDRLSKFARLIAMLETAKTEYVIRLFKENWVRDFGLPKSIVSDRDVRFTSELWKAAAAEQGTQLQMTSGNHPEANGQAEQMNRAVQHLLRHYIKPNQVDWDEKLALVARADTTMSAGCRSTLLRVLVVVVAMSSSPVYGRERLLSGANPPASKQDGSDDEENLKGWSLARRWLQTDDSGCLSNFSRFQSTSDLLTCRKQLVDKIDRTRNAEDVAVLPAAAEGGGGDSVFFVLNGRVWRRNASESTTMGEGSRWQASEVTPIFGPSEYNRSTGESGRVDDLRSLAMLDVMDGGGQNNKSRKVMFVEDRTNRVVRWFSIDGLEPAIEDFRNFSNDTGGFSMISLAGYAEGGVLYGSTRSALYRMNVTGTYDDRPKLWLGSESIKDVVNSPIPGDVRFDRAYLSTSAITANGEAMYVLERNADVVRRVLIASGAVETVAGIRGARGDADGLASEATFNEPIGQALTADGCNLFVGEVNDNRGRIRLVSFQRTGTYVRTVANLNVPVIRLAMHPNGELLYAAAGAGSVFEISVNKSVLPQCSGDVPPKKKAGVSKTVIALAGIVPALVGFLLAVALAVKIRRGAECDWVWPWPRWGRLGPCLPTKDENPQPGGKHETALLTSFWDESGSQSTWDTGRSLSGVRTQELQPSGPRRFSFSELADACDGFNSSNLVGKGGAAEVFRGVLTGGQVVALKVMKDEDLSRALLGQFQAELDFLGPLRHSHVLSIIGFCAEEGKSVIVYPFVAGGSLYDRLHPRFKLASSPKYEGDGVSDIGENLSQADVQTVGSGSGCTSTSCPWQPPAWRPLSWSDRFSIALQIGKALRFLHESLDPPVVHRDIKSKNILLEGGGSTGLRAYLSDFGLARQGQSVFSAEKAGETVETHHVAGTIGYMAPEYFTYCRLTAKNDVYAFGVVLLELITGCKAFGTVSDYRKKGEGGHQVEEEEEEEEGKDRVPTEEELPQMLTKWVRKMVEDMVAPMSSEEEGKRRATEETLKLEVVRKIADERMVMCGEVDWVAVTNMLELAMTCITEMPDKRPPIGSVVKELARLEASEKQLVDNSVNYTSDTVTEDVAVLAAAAEEGGDSVFFVLNGIVWRRNASTRMAQGSRWQSSEVTPIFGPWPGDGGGRAELTALVIVDIKDGGQNHTRKVIFVEDGANRVLRWFSIDGRNPAIEDFRNFTIDTSGAPITSLAGYSRGGVLYASTRWALYRMNLTGTDDDRPKLWLGLPAKTGVVDSPMIPLFRNVYLSTSAITANGEAMYVLEHDSHVVRRVLIESRAVETVAGSLGVPGGADGLASEARFNAPLGQALTADGCNLFVGEMNEGKGRIRLVSFKRNGAYVRTVAKLSVPVIRLAMHPNNELLYAAAGAGSVFEISVNNSVLPKCSGDPDKKNGASRTTIALAVTVPALVGFLIAVALAVKIRRGAECDWVWHWRLWRRLGRSLRTKDDAPQPGGEQETARLTLPVGNGASESGFGASGSFWDKSGFQSTWDTNRSLSGVRTRELQPSGPRRFSLSELADACDGFNSSNLVGKGGAAEVFRGVLTGGQVVALKVMKDGDLSRARLWQFQAELDFLGRIRHSHVLSLLGFCAEGGKSVIVYPFVAGGSLYDRLHPHFKLASFPKSEGDGVSDIGGNLSESDVQTVGSGSGCTSTSCPWQPPAWGPLSWRDRLSIALQIGKALQFLHEELDPPVIHRDIKSNNILLEGGGGSGLRAYLSDFGLARQGQSVFSAEKAGETVETYHVAGTVGYMAPEYFTYCRLTAKNDVYAFGVVLLELITGYKAFGTPANYRKKGEGGHQVEEEEKGTDLVLTEEGKEEEIPQVLTRWVRKMVEDMIARMSSEEEGKRRATEESSKLEVIQRIADERMQMCGEVDWVAVSHMLELAMMCITEMPEQRPRIGSVVEELAQLEGSESL
ncbi:hypothetical protein CBR_g45698 [Chara braunii]|uniref:Uncharacterized protein n=1 Tax=Chara braunii TaxID=69332 RepID=A0A388K3X1_CHABU|nr:hypothetical protein CBR_g45698 [Chara braunii]|eukprot:GBG64643.1 hypothetical protein CBR_g45698 [Chara braunii]